MNLLLQSLLGAISEPDGKLSSRRINSCATTLTALMVWAWLSIQKGELLNPPEWMVAWVVGSGALVAMGRKTTTPETKL